MFGSLDLSSLISFKDGLFEPMLIVSQMLFLLSSITITRVLQLVNYPISKLTCPSASTLMLALTLSLPAMKADPGPTVKLSVGRVLEKEDAEIFFSASFRWVQV